MTTVMTVVCRNIELPNLGAWAASCAIMVHAGEAAWHLDAALRLVWPRW